MWRAKEVKYFGVSGSTAESQYGAPLPKSPEPQLFFGGFCLLPFGLTASSDPKWAMLVHTLYEF